MSLKNDVIDGKRKRRAQFLYRSNRYDFPVTDPNFEMLLESGPSHKILCVSLGEKFDAFGDGSLYCYKIVAAVF